MNIIESLNRDLVYLFVAIYEVKNRTCDHVSCFPGLLLSLMVPTRLKKNFEIIVFRDLDNLGKPALKL